MPNKVQMPDPITISIVEAATNVLGALFSAKQKIEAQTIDRRTAAADLLSEVAKTLKHVVKVVKRGEVPGGDCAKLQIYADGIAEVFAKPLGRSQAARLAAQIHWAHDVENTLLNELNQLDSSGYARALKILDEQAGRFQGLSDMIRAKV
jgi:hypothetical protein